MKRVQQKLLASMIAIALGSATVSAHALELGDAVVRSALGERLLIEIPLGNADLAAPSCFRSTLTDAPAGSGRLNQRKLPGVLVLSTSRIVTEPLLNLRVVVECPNVPRLRREYTLFIDPASRVAPSQRELSAAARGLRPATRRRIAASPTPIQAAASRAVQRTPMVDGTRYRVQTGDTVSEIAAQIKHKDQDLWTVVDQIVADNPDAFIDNNPDRLVAGSVLALTVAVVTNSPPPQSPPPLATPPEPTPTPPAPAASATTGSSTSDLPGASSSDAQKLLSLLQGENPTTMQTLADPVATDEAGGDSPFKPAATANADDTPLVVSPAIAASAASPWWGRITAMVVGMATALGIWILWQIAAGMSARRRRAAAAASSVSALSRRDAIAAADAPSLASREVSDGWHNDVSSGSRTSPVDDAYQVEFVMDDAQTVEIDNTAPPPSDQRFLEAEPVVEVSALENTGVFDYSHELDENTQKMLEQDYEAQLTRTQQIEKELAERALGITPDEHDAAASDGDDDAIGYSLAISDDMFETVSMQGDHLNRRASDRTHADTERLPQQADFADDNLLADDTIAGFSEPLPEDATVDMDLELDLDDDDAPSVSHIMQISAEELSEALGEHDDDSTLEMDQVKRTASKRRA